MNYLMNIVNSIRKFWANGLIYIALALIVWFTQHAVLGLALLSLMLLIQFILILIEHSHFSSYIEDNKSVKRNFDERVYSHLEISTFKIQCCVIYMITVIINSYPDILNMLILSITGFLYLFVSNTILSIKIK